MVLLRTCKLRSSAVAVLTLIAYAITSCNTIVIAYVLTYLAVHAAAVVRAGGQC
jgi:hypothetical protein